eukprot:g20327.t1
MQARGGALPRDWRAAQQGINIGTFNVRTLGRADVEGKSLEQESLLRDARERKLMVVFVQESRIAEWLVADQWDEFFVWGGGAEKTASGGTAYGSLVMVHQSLSAIGCSDKEHARVVRVVVGLKLGKKLHLISAYAPTEPSTADKKRKFYEKLSEEVAAASKYDEVVIGGDFNAELGNPETELIESSLPYTVGREFALQMDAELGKTLTASRIAELEQRSSAREAWQEFESKARVLALELKKKIAKEGGGGKRKPWIKDTTWKLVQQRGKWDGHGRANTVQRAILRSKIRRALKRDREQWVEEMVGDLRRADASGNSRLVFERVRQLAGRARKPAQELPGGEKRHVEFWKGVLGTKRPDAPEGLKETRTWKRCEEKIREPAPKAWSTGELAGAPSMAEVKAAVRGLKQRKSFSGLLPSEFFAESAIGLRIVWLVVKKIFEGDKPPDDWLEAAVALLHKSGKKAEPGNYRPVALLSVGEKLLSLIILRRVQKAAYSEIDGRQKGSAQGSSCRHAVFRLLRDVEKVIINGDETVFMFIDFRKAYDSLCWDKMHKILAQLGLPRELGEVLERMYEGSTFRLKLGREKLSERIKQASGIRQGSSLSPLVFILVLQWALQRFEETALEKGFWTQRQVEAMALTWLGYVDDIVVKAKGEKEAQEILRELEAACFFVGLQLNGKKTEAITTGLEAKKKNNEDAQVERFHLQDDEDRAGWMIEWDGVDLREEWSAAAKTCRKDLKGKATHLLVWDNGQYAACSYRANGWATVGKQGGQRLIRLGQVQYVLEERNKHKCDRCGDILPDAKALRHHKASGFCRTNKDEKTLRTLRVGRQNEAKAKSEGRKKLVVQAQIETHDGVPVRAVGAFKYLGTQLDNSGRTSGEVLRRTGTAKTVVRQLHRIWRDHSLPRHLKATLYGSLVSSVALYNGECWTLGEPDWKALRAFQLSTLKAVAGEKHWTKVQTEVQGDEEKEEEEDEEQQRTSRMELCARLGVVDVETQLKEKRVAWAAHAARHKNEGSYWMIEKEVTTGTAWGKQLKKDLEEYGLDLGSLAEIPDAKELRETMTSRRKIAAAKREKAGKKSSRAVTEQTREMREERRKRIDEAIQKRKEDEEQKRLIRLKIDDTHWVRLPGAGKKYSAKTATGEVVEFEETFEWDEENTGRTYK